MIATLTETMTTINIKKTDEYYMRQALVEAQLAFEQQEVPIGAIIVCKDRIIARAHNLTETLNDVTAHAEMQAITSAAATLGGKYLIDCTLYVTAEPCPMCAAALGWAQIARIVYGATDEKRGFQKIAPSVLHPKTTVESGILAEEAAALMQQFFQAKRHPK
ncbi:tRNA-specific adenosine deaminase [Bacteroidia bacterium]|nr:tRNA-specific adenosine deaminase [Bacteroidia bacterium]